MRTASRRTGRRVPGVVTALGVGAGLITAASFALFSSQIPGTVASFAAGTVTLATTGGTACNISGVQPGASGTCTYTIKYTGTLNAWVALDVSATSMANPAYGEALLKDGTDTQGLQVTLSDTLGNTLLFPTVTCPYDSAPPTGAEGTASNPCTGSATNQLLLNNANVGDDGSNDRPFGSWAPGQSDTVTLKWSLPTNTPGAFKESSATITLTGHAVQASNDPLCGGAPVLGWTGASPSSASCGGGGVVRGFTQGYWHSNPGIQTLTGVAGGTTLLHPQTLGSGGRTFTVTTVSQSNTILPGPGGHDACSAGIFNCEGGSNLSSGLGTNTMNNLSSQTLALAYNVAYVGGFSGETLAQLGCVTSDAQALGFAGATTVNQVLNEANLLIGGSVSGGTTTQQQASAMTNLLGQCVNQET